MSDGGDCRTAPATPGLLKTGTRRILYSIYLKEEAIKLQEIIRVQLTISKEGIAAAAIHKRIRIPGSTNTDVTDLLTKLIGPDLWNFVEHPV